MSLDPASEPISESMAVLMERRDRWLAAEIRKLSVDILSQGMFTCTECGEVSGTYIIKCGAETRRLPAPEAYALLQFVATEARA